MSVDTDELVRICEQLPEAKRAEVTDFARFLLAKNGGEASQTLEQRGAAERWLATASGAAKAGVTTAQVMALTRGEP